MAPIPEMLPTATPMMTWVVPLQTAPALREFVIGGGTIVTLVLLHVAACALNSRAPTTRTPGWHWFRVSQA